MIHDFHMVVQADMKNKLKKLAEELGISYSHTVVFIINRFLPILEKNTLEKPEENNKYQVIFAETDIHIFMPEKIYRKLRMIKTIMNIFSIAILIRRILVNFMKNIEKFGIWGYLNKLKEKEKKILKTIQRKRIWIKRQLSGNFPISPYILFYFTDNYELFKAKFLPG